MRIPNDVLIANLAYAGEAFVLAAERLQELEDQGIVELEYERDELRVRNEALESQNDALESQNDAQRQIIEQQAEDLEYYRTIEQFKNVLRASGLGLTEL